MKWLFRIFLLLRGCRHKWTVMKQFKVFESEDSTIPCETKIILQCSKCGDMMMRKF